MGLFGNTATSSLFGNTATTSNSLFGSNSQLGQKPALGSTMSFSNITTTTAASGGLFGSTLPKSTPASPFSFSAPKANQSSLFGFNAASSSPGTNLFGVKPTQTTSMFGQQPATTALVPVANQARPNVNSNVEAFYASLSQPLLLGDERDAVIARWNQLQAMYGIGIGYCALGPVNYTADNTFSRFKTIAYNVQPTSTDADGFVRLIVQRPVSDVYPLQQNIKDLLFQLLGNRSTIQIDLEEIRPCLGSRASTHCEVTVRVKERQSSAASATIVSSTELLNFLSSPTCGPQLQSKLAVADISAEIAPSPSQLAAYFETPPAGFDKLVWQQFKIDNPAPDCLLPVPLIGLAELKQRKVDQISFAKHQVATLKSISDLSRDLKGRGLLMSQKIFHLKRKQVELSHRILKVLSRQEIQRKAGFAISGEEEMLRCGLEKLWNELLSPQGLRARLQELVCSMDASNQRGSDADTALSAPFDRKPGVALNLDEDGIKTLHDYLAQRTHGINELRLTLKSISAKLKIIKQSPPRPNTVAAGTNDPLILGQNRPLSRRVTFA